MKKLLFLPLYYAIACITVPFVTTLFIPSEEPMTEKTISSAEPEATVSVLNHLSGVTESMSMEDYLIGVVAAEMPAIFEPEALKAQAVAARTYSVYKQGSQEHTADVCTDYNHCQAYLTDSDMHTNWGTDYEFYREKIKNAVYSTQGELLTYNSEPVMAVFHSMGGGKTESSADVWGSQLPYLVSVESPGEETAANYRSEVVVPFEEFKEKILTEYPTAKIDSFLDISQPTLTQGGHVKSIIAGSVSIPGTKIRTLFNLRSTKFDITFHEGSIKFSVTGYGHGVGMSQYGANAMAKEGKTYKEILSHYYPGTLLSE